MFKLILIFLSTTSIVFSQELPAFPEVFVDTLHIKGLRMQIDTVSTMDSSHYFMKDSTLILSVSTGTSNDTIVLPYAMRDGRVYVIKKSDAGNGYVYVMSGILTPTAVTSILPVEGAPLYGWNTQKTYWFIKSNGNYYLINN